MRPRVRGRPLLLAMASNYLCLQWQLPPDLMASLHLNDNKTYILKLEDDTKAQASTSSVGNSLGLRELLSSCAQFGLGLPTGLGRLLKGTASPTETGRTGGARTPATASGDSTSGSSCPHNTSPSQSHLSECGVESIFGELSEKETSLV